MKRFNLGYFIAEGFRNIFAHGLMSFAAVCMIICCLLIMGSFSLVAVNLNNMLGSLEKENEFLAYVDENYTTAQSMSLQVVLDKIPNVASATFVSREQAMAEFKADFASQEQTAAELQDGKNQNELMKDLPPSVFRDRYRIHVVDIQQMKNTLNQVVEVEGIVNYQAALEIAQGFVVVRNIAGGVAAILVAILLLVSLFIITNTIRLATFNRREEIAIMKMCGATNGFIRWPFVFEGLILGVMGAVVAFFLQWGIYELISTAIVKSDTIHLIKVLNFQPVALFTLGIFAATGLVIGVGGSLLAIRKFLQV